MKIAERKPKIYTGRRVITTQNLAVTSSNVIEIVKEAMVTHTLNSTEISDLYNYYKGDQPILRRKKKVRPEINNMVVENQAYSIVSFFSGYVFGDPIQYVRRAAVTSEDEKGDGAKKTTLNITKLNEFMFAEDKAAVDKELADWMLIGGVGYRGILPDEMLDQDEDDSPFEITALDPRRTFVVYSNRFGLKPVMACQVVTLGRTEGDVTVPQRLVVWTPDRYYEIKGEQIILDQPHVLGNIPVVEYTLNHERMGVFEHVLSLLDAINTIQSNRVDGLEQFIQSILKFTNVDITKEMLEQLSELGAISISSNDNINKADLDILSQELNQDQNQTLVDYLTQQVLVLCGMPNRGGSRRTTGDTGQAVMLRDGWSDAETKAKGMELMFKRSEKQFLRLALKIILDLRQIPLKLSDVDIKFTRNRTDNLLVKTQGLQNMLEAGIHPQVAISLCGLFSDSEQVYLDSQKYLEKWEYAGKPDPFQKPDVVNDRNFEDGSVKSRVDGVEGMTTREATLT